MGAYPKTLVLYRNKDFYIPKFALESLFYLVKNVTRGDESSPAGQQGAARRDSPTSGSGGRGGQDCRIPRAGKGMRYAG